MSLSVGKVRQFYYDKGLSATETGRRLDASVWQVIKFMKKHNLPRRTAAETKRIAFKKAKPSFKIRRTLTVEQTKLKIAGIMLFWAEGTTSANTVDFANSDPEMIGIFLKFLREICRIDENKLRVLLYCYSNQDVDELKFYWSQLTNIPISQFSKPYVRHDFSNNGRRMKYGLVHIRYADKKLIWQIEKWKKKFLNSCGGRAVKCTSL